MRTITFVLLLVNIRLSSETCAALSPCQRHVGGEPHSECDEAPQAFIDSSVGSVGDAINYGLKVRNGSGGHGSKEEPTPSLPGLSHTALETGPIANSGSLSTLTTIWTNSSSHAGSGTVSVAESDDQTKSAENLGTNPTKSFDGTASNGSSAISNSNTGVAIFVSVVPTNRSLGPSQTTRPPYPMNSTHTIGLDPELVSVISKYGPGITAAPRPVFVSGIPRFGNNTCDQHNKTSCPSTKTLKIGAAHQAQPGLFQIGKGWAGTPKEPSGPGALGPVLLANEGSAGEGSEVPSHAQADHVTSAADADITRFSPEVHTSQLRQGAAFSPESHTTQTNMVVGPAAAGPSSTSTSQSRAGGNRGPDFTAWRHETAVPVQSSSSGGDSEIGGAAPGPDPGASSVAGQDEANDSAPGGIPQPGGSSNHDNPAIPMQAPPVQAGRPPPGVPPAGQPGPGQVPAGQPPLNVPAASQQANGPQVPAPPPPGTGSTQPPLPLPRKGEPQITVGGAVLNVLPESTLEAHSTAAALRPVSSAGAGGIAFQGAHSTAAALRPVSSAGTGGAATHGGEPPGSGQIPPGTSDGTAGSADDPAAPGTSPGKPGSEEGGEAAVPGTVANPLGHVPQNVAHPAGSLPNGAEAGLPPQPPPPPGDVTAGSPSSPPPDNANPPKAASPVIITHSNSPIAVQPIAPSTITKGASTITQLPSGADFITSANQVFSPIASFALSFSTVSGIPIPVAVVPSVQQQTPTDESGEVHTFPLSVPPIPLKPAPPATTTIDALGNPQTIIPNLFPSPPPPSSSSNPIGETGGNTATILPFAPPAPPGISIQAFPSHPLLITSFPTTTSPPKNNNDHPPSPSINQLVPLPIGQTTITASTATIFTGKIIAYIPAIPSITTESGTVVQIYPASPIFIAHAGSTEAVVTVPLSDTKGGGGGGSTVPSISVTTSSGRVFAVVPTSPISPTSIASNGADTATAPTTTMTSPSSSASIQHPSNITITTSSSFFTVPGGDSLVTSSSSAPSGTLATTAIPTSGAATPASKKTLSGTGFLLGVIAGVTLLFGGYLL